MKNEFWQSPTYKLIKAMKATGNQPGVIAQWIAGAELWAGSNGGPEARALLEWLPMWQARPFYTVRELAPIVPALIVGHGISKYLPEAKSAKRLWLDLTFGGLPQLKNADGLQGFENPASGLREQYFIVEQLHKWRDLELTQEEFENVLFG